jgi:hypothetical protein
MLVGAVLVMEGIPCTEYMMGRMRPGTFYAYAAAAGAGIIAVCALAAAIPFGLGLRAFNRREV